MQCLISILILGLAAYIIYYFQSQEKTKEISRLKRRISVLEKTQSQLENKNKQGEDFVYFVSHELKSPLTIIKGYSSILLDGTVGKLDPKEKELLKKVFASNEEAINLVEDLLLVSRLEGQRMKYEFIDQDLNSLIEEAIQEFITLSGKKIKFDFSQGKDILTKVDVDSFREVFRRLLANASRGSQKVEIETQKKAGRLLISFRDKGAYPAPELRKKYFDKAATKKEKKIWKKYLKRKK